MAGAMMLPAARPRSFELCVAPPSSPKTIRTRSMRWRPTRLRAGTRGEVSQQRAIDLSPSFALGHFALGRSRLAIGRPVAAIEALQRGLRLNPNDPQAFVWMN